MRGTKYTVGTILQLPNGRWKASAVKGGKQLRKRFKTKKDAERFLESVRDDRKPLTPSQLVDCQNALAALSEASVTASLTSIVHQWLNLARPKNKPVKEAVIEYLGEGEGSLAELTQRRYANLLGHFARELDKETGSISVDDVKAFISRHCSPDKPESILGCRRTIGTFLKWCQKHRYILENPCDLIRPPRITERKIQWYTVEEVQKIMATAMQDDPALGPYLILGFFAGLRPIERARLSASANMIVSPDTGRWSALNITGDVAKGSGFARRYIELSPQCQRMLQFWESEFGELREGITPAGESTTTSRVRDVVLKAVGHYIKDGERHTYATNHFAAFQNGPLTAKICGHSENIALAHYRGRISKQDGEAFMAIIPEVCGLEWWGKMPGENWQFRDNPTFSAGKHGPRDLRASGKGIPEGWPS